MLNSKSNEIQKFLAKICNLCYFFFPPILWNRGSFSSRNPVILLLLHLNKLTWTMYPQGFILSHGHWTEWGQVNRNSCNSQTYCAAKLHMPRMMSWSHFFRQFGLPILVYVCVCIYIYNYVNPATREIWEELKAMDGDIHPCWLPEEARLTISYRTSCVLWVITLDLLDPEHPVNPEA